MSGGTEGTVIFITMVTLLCLAVTLTSIGGTHLFAHIVARRISGNPNRGDVTAGLRVVTPVWLLAVLSLLGFQAWRGWSYGSYLNQINTLTQQADQRAREIAKAQGEVEERGPIYQAEYGPRWVKAQQQPVTPTESRIIEWAVVLVWVVCPITIGIYYFVLFRKSCGRLATLSLSFVLMLVQFLVVGSTTAMFAFVAYQALGGIE